MALFFSALQFACASLPDVRYLGERQLATPRQPTVVTSRGPLPTDRAKALLGNIAAKSGATEMLARHVAAEEAISGKPLVAGNRVTLLADGPLTMRAIMQAIEAARDHINLETYIIEDDEVGRALADLLIRKRGAGLQVNLIYDSVGSIGTPAAFFERLRRAGVNVLEYNPINPLKAEKNWDINQRDHRKILVVDGKVAFTGGVNISRVYGRSSLLRGRPPPGPRDAKQAAWRDTHMRIEGPVVAEFQALFLDTWRRKTGEDLPPANYFPTLAPTGKALVRAIGSTAEKADFTIYKTYVSALSNAEKYAHLTVAYFVPDRQIVEALTKAAARGVDVKLIFPSFTDHGIVLYASRSFYEELLAAGVKIYERSNALLHAKTAVIDGVWSTIGSTNLDMRSFLHNDEVNAVVLDADFAQKMEALFERDLQESTEITVEQWSKRGLTQRLREWAVRMFGYWL